MTSWRSMRRRTRKRIVPWVVIGVVALAAALRLPFLTARSLWFDEAFSWRLVAYVPSAEFFQRAAADVHPVLYYALLWFWMLPARGAGPEGTIFWMRALSVVLGCATVAAMATAGRILFRSRWTGAVAGLLTAVNAFQVQYAWEARMYTLGTALLPLAMAALSLVATARSSRAAWRGGLAFALSLGALLHVHYYALFSWFALGAAKLLYFFGQWRRCVRGDPSFRSPLRPALLGRAGLRGAGRTTLWRRFRAAEVGFWLSALLFLPWLPVFLRQAAHVQAAFWIPNIDAWSIPKTLARLFWGGARDIPETWAVLATLAAAALVAVALVRGRSVGDLIAAAAFVIPIGLSALVSLRTSVFLDRYFLFASLGLILLVARALSFLPQDFTVLRKTVKSRFGGDASLRTTALLLLAALGLVSLARFWSTLDFPRHPGARGAAAFLRAHVQPGEPIVVSSPFAYFPMSFHLGCDPKGSACADGRTVRLYSDTGELLHFAGGPILTRQDLVGSEVFRVRGPTDEGPGRLWVVDTTGFGGSRLVVPEPFILAREASFPELFPYQGDIIVREYRY